MSGYAAAAVLVAHHKSPGSVIASIACLAALFVTLLAATGRRK